MKITGIRTTPLLVPYKVPYHWARGVEEGATVVLVEVESDGGLVGLGESLGAPDAEAVVRILRGAVPHFLGQSPFDIARLMALARRPVANTPRFANQIFTGLEMALWDLAGKAAGQPVHRLLGGAVRSEVQYFGFLQGETAAELAADAERAAAEGFAVIYLKIGRGEALDLENVAAVRAAIGDRRLRLDANEAWDPLTAIRMIRALSRFDPEFLEQPTPSHSLEALAQVKQAVGLPIAADQCVYTAADVYEVCRRRAADVIVLGLHEAGGLLGLKKAAAVAEAAGLCICLHGVFETGITTCAANQLAATLPNLDDGNQIMCQLLAEDIVAAPELTPARGRLPVFESPGLGFELDRDAVTRAAERYSERA
jgi:muconate cycloisomerase